MMLLRNKFLTAIVTALLVAGTCSAEITDVQSLVTAIHQGAPGDTIEIPEGVYQLKAPLVPKQGMTLKGSGVGKTIITADETWDPGTKQLPQQENPEAYLFNFSKTSGVTISDMTLRGPKLHGAIYCNDSDGLELHHLHLENFLWSSVRTFRMDNFRVHDCVFVDAGGKQKHAGGALYMHWTKDSEFWNNRILKTDQHPTHYYGIKGRKAERCRIHHNTIEVGFSIEFPFENDHEVTIDHNALAATISIPKHSGGPVIEDGKSFHIHHNWIRKSYAIEFARNSVEIDHNFFDFRESDDKGNLISNFGPKAPGPAKMHHNQILNPGRGVLWTRSAYHQFHFYNNHVKANITTRQDGLFGFPKDTDFKTIILRDNIIECSEEHPRPLMRNQQSYSAIIKNNKLVNISDAEEYPNPQTDAVQGLTEPLKFRCGVHGEYQVDGWEVRRIADEK